MASPPDYYISSNSDYDANYYINSPDASSQHSLNNKIMVVAIVVLFSVIFFIISLHIYGKWAWRSFSRRNSGRTRFFHPNRATTASDGHRRFGLSRDTIAKLPTFTYKAPVMSRDLEAGEALNGETLECAVCLSEFQEDEIGRVLPSCKHSFHIDCIDMWFYSHSTCPLCRALVMPTVVSTTPAAMTSVSSDAREHRAEELASEIARDAAEATSSMQEDHHVDDHSISTNDRTPNVMQIPTNVHCSGELIHTVHSQLGSLGSSEKPSESSPLPPPLSSSGSVSSSNSSRRVPQIKIQIPTSHNISLRSPGCISVPSRKSRCASPALEAACSSLRALVSPGFRVSAKTILAP